MRRRWIQIDGELVPEEEALARKAEQYRGAGPLIVPDIEPYQSIITGETISSRSQHRAHLRKHGCIEVGDQRPQFLDQKYERERQRPVWGRDGRRIR